MSVEPPAVSAQRLDETVSMLREFSRQTDPQKLIEAFQHLGEPSPPASISCRSVGADFNIRGIESRDMRGGPTTSIRGRTSASCPYWTGVC